MKKFLVCLCVIVMIFSMGTVAFAISNEVIFENESISNPNNSMNNADEVQMVSGNSHYVIGVVSNDDKEDWFKLHPFNNGEGIFSLREGSSINSYLYLYDENGKYISSAKDSISNIYIRSNSTYYVRVKYVSGTAVEPYRLQITVVK